MKLTEFENNAIQALKKIPKGKITTYGLIAKYLGKPKAARAVGNACHKNPDAPRTPCHRVIKSDGQLGGYGGGAKRKIELLKKELILVKDGQVINYINKLYKY